MAKMYTMREIAEIAGVSYNTVWMALKLKLIEDTENRIGTYRVWTEAEKKKAVAILKERVAKENRGRGRKGGK